MRKAKVGDRIRILTDLYERSGHRKGDIEVVIAVSDSGPYTSCSCGTCDYKRILWCLPNYYELVDITLEDIMQMVVLGEDVQSDVFLEALAKTNLT